MMYVVFSMLGPLGSFSVAELGLALTESYYGQWPRVGRIKERHKEDSEASLKDSVYAESTYAEGLSGRASQARQRVGVRRLHSWRARWSRAVKSARTGMFRDQRTDSGIYEEPPKAHCSCYNRTICKHPKRD